MIKKKRNINLIIVALVFLVLLAIILYLILSYNKSINVIDENLKTVSFKHDSTWKLKQHNDNFILLKHNSGSLIKIQVTEVNYEYKYSSIDELVDELLYNIQNQNKNYKLISKKNEVISVNRYNSYKFLYENDNEQVMVVVYKIGDKLISYIYEASNDYFDILLDSVHSIINSLLLKDESYELRDSIKLNLADISYVTNSEFDQLLVNSRGYQTAKENYLVEYELPSIFNVSDINSAIGYYAYKMDTYKGIDITVNIYNTNLYESFDEERASYIYSQYSYFRDDKTGNYNNFKESLNKFESKYDSYIYKCSFDYKSTQYDVNQGSITVDEHNEIVRLLFALDNKHTLDISIRGTGLPITEKLINSVKIKNTTNYSSYVLNNKEGKYLVGELKTFADYKKDRVIKTKILLPDKYQEIDPYNDSNFYVDRYYRLNYDEKYDLYDYEVDYELNNISIDFDSTCKSKIDSINSIYIKTTYGKYQKMSFTKQETINGKEFYIYDGGYTDRSGVIFQNSRKDYYVNKKVLFYQINDKYCVIININGNGQMINDELLKEVTNFTISEENL